MSSLYFHFVLVSHWINPFYCFDGALMCGASGLHNGQTHLPPSFSRPSTALFSSVFGIWSFIFLSLSNSSLSVHAASNWWAIAGLSWARMLLSIHTAFSWAITRCVSKSSVGASTALRATESAQRAVRAHVS